MSKAIKFSDNVYLDSKSITHNQQSLSDLLNALFEYSNKEVVIGTWSDGRKIYKRSFMGSIEGDDATQVTYELRADNSEILFASGWVGDSVNGMVLGGYVNASWYCGVWMNASVLHIYASPSLYYKPYKINVIYLKR